MTERPTIRLTKSQYLAETPPFPADASRGRVVGIVQPIPRHNDVAALTALLKETK